MGIEVRYRNLAKGSAPTANECKGSRLRSSSGRKISFHRMDTHMLTEAVAEEGVDLREILDTLRDRWRVIAVAGVISTLLSVVYAFLIAKPVFESTAMLIPTEAQSPDQLGAAAALLGKKTLGNGDVTLYQSLLTSRRVLNKLLYTSVSNMSDSGLGRNENLYKTLGLDTSSSVSRERTINSLAHSIKVGSRQSEDNGILEVKFSAQNGWLAQQICNNLLEVGLEELRQVRISRSKAILSRLEAADSVAAAEWDSSASIYSRYREQNRSITQPSGILDLARLEMGKAAKEQKYLLVRREYEMQQLEATKAAPPMIVFDPANLPAKKSKPQRALLVVLGLFAGILCSSVFVIGKKVFGFPVGITTG